MKILVVSPYLHPEGGGLERYAHEVALGLSRQGHEVVHAGHASVVREATTAEGVREIGFAPDIRLSNAPLSFSALREVRRLLRRERFDVVNVHTPVPGTAELAALAARWSGVPYVVTYHAGRLESQSPALAVVAAAHRWTFQRMLLAGASGRIAVSPYVARHVFGERDAYIVAPGVDTARFQPPADARRERGRILFVGPVARAYAWKGLATLRDAFVRVEDEFPEAHLRIVGEGDLVEEYRAWADARGLGERVQLVGRVSDAQLADEYARATVAVLPSWTPAESFGMVLAEANACGTPVIGSDVGGIPYFVRDGENGLLVRPKFITGLADALRRILGNEAEARAMGERGRERVARELTWTHVATQTEGALAAAIEGRLGPGAPTARPALRG